MIQFYYFVKLAEMMFVLEGNLRSIILMCASYSGKLGLKTQYKLQNLH